MQSRFCFHFGTILGVILGAKSVQTVMWTETLFFTRFVVQQQGFPGRLQLSPLPLRQAFLRKFRNRLDNLRKDFRTLSIQIDRSTLYIYIYIYRHIYIYIYIYTLCSRHVSL